MVYCYTDENIRILLKQLRLKRKLSQVAVAERLRVTKGYISQVELGKTKIPRYRLLIEMLEVYEIKPKYFEELLSQMK